MRYALICLDKPNALQTRVENRAAHLAYIQDTRRVVEQAGPFIDAAGQMCGSLLILSVVGTQGRSGGLGGGRDPYARAGLFSSL